MIMTRSLSLLPKPTQIYVGGSPNQNRVSLQKSRVSITTDASQSGWGAHCNELKTSGNWSNEETGKHINYLDLLAVLFALKVFIREHRRTLIRVCIVIPQLR